ncbi:MAG: PIN domain-containing protein [Nitriliruptoraceae bacterium]|nr:PIN domain-containing protein [Nitriliruptoraceae bacterium]
MTPPTAVDTNVLIAALVLEHDHHDLAIEAAADATHVLGQVTVEAWSVLRRHFRLPADLVATMLDDYRASRLMIAPSVGAYDRTLQWAPDGRFAGNIHDAVIVQTAAEAELRIVTLDVGLQRLASGVVSCELLTDSAST